jgi:hypothetical protein
LHALSLQKKKKKKTYLIDISFPFVRVQFSQWRVVLLRSCVEEALVQRDATVAVPADLHTVVQYHIATWCHRNVVIIVSRAWHEQQQCIGHFH